MIGFLTGKLVTKQPPHIYLDVNGVGYFLAIPMSCFYGLPDCGATITLHTHLSVREDAWQLYGFTDKADRDLFQLLIKVSGIGPKVGLALLSGLNRIQIIAAISDNQIEALTAVPGIGPKTATRLIMETRDKILKIAANNPERFATEAGMDQQKHQTDALDALLALGYKPALAKRTIAKIGSVANTAEELIRLSLQRMTTGANA